MIDLLEYYFPNCLRIEKLSESNMPANFSVPIDEYAEYLKTEALNAQKSFIANTYVLIENQSNKVMAFISLICDSVTFTFSEKDITHLSEFPFSNFPAIKVAKLAVSEDFKNKYKHIGSFMLQFAKTIAFTANEENAACRFLTVDADIENNPTVTEFYKKNGFKLLSDKKYTKKTKICCMWKDILS